MLNHKRIPLGQVVVIYNLDRNWPKSDQENVERLVTLMLNGLSSLEVEVDAVEIHDSLEPLRGYHPDETLIFNWCEGFIGMPWSDFLVAKELEAHGFIYTGASSRTLHRTVNKEVIKKILFEAGVPTPPGRALHHEQAKDWHVFPAMVKPAGQHCSFGVSRASVVESQAELVRQIRRLEKEFGGKVLVEPFINGREFHVGVWGNRKPETLPLVELDFSHYTDIHDRLYTFESKFNPQSEGWNSIDWLCPAPVEPELEQEIQNVAIMAYRAMRCRDYARMDMRLWNGTPMVLDVNPNADLDPDSVIPLAAKELGHDYGEVAYRILEFAAIRLRNKLATRHRRLRKATTSV
ncbi:ATP-grasp domain-containing protein [candidate division KSB1 bacterium]|nr:ATP-grasp domain-containing protein [candidate division KSB1 bacterium]